jgi:hypothetical protein
MFCEGGKGAFDLRRRNFWYCSWCYNDNETMSPWAFLRGCFETSQISRRILLVGVYLSLLETLLWKIVFVITVHIIMFHRPPSLLSPMISTFLRAK